ncbi:MAG: hypothetical protein ABTQ34_05715 [Bdellovibrionales bacterium]
MGFCNRNRNCQAVAALKAGLGKLNRERYREELSSGDDAIQSPIRKPFRLWIAASIPPKAVISSQ